jgi:hypothetical protein
MVIAAETIARLVMIAEAALKSFCKEARGSPMKCPYCESGTNDFVPMNQTAEYSGIEMSVNRQGMLRVRVLDDDGGFTTQDIVEIRSCPLCGKRFVKG